jgi:DNA-directed RNA polymerase subunit RPC12/RpoP
MKNKKFAPTHWFDISSTGVFNPHNLDFRCAHCGQFVSADALLAGVYNRNHCPYCLWSRHMDWRKPGDRLAACKSPMRPIGLSVKRSRNKYAADDKTGELMLIHLCADCGKVSINRLAADDDCQTLLNAFEDSFTLDGQTRLRLEAEQIAILQAEDWQLVRRRLLGRDAALVSGVSLG